MILNHINHKMPIYKDCTLGEMLAVSVTTFSIMSISLSLLTKLLLGYASIGIAITVLSIVHLSRYLLGRLQRIKYGKPYGYYQQLLLRKLQHYQLIQSLLKISYVQRQGKWSVRR